MIAYDVQFTEPTTDARTPRSTTRWPARRGRCCHDRGRRATATPTCSAADDVLRADRGEGGATAAPTDDGGVIRRVPRQRSTACELVRGRRGRARAGRPRGVGRLRRPRRADRLPRRRRARSRRLVLATCSTEGCRRRAARTGRRGRGLGALAAGRPPGADLERRAHVRARGPGQRDLDGACAACRCATRRCWVERAGDARARVRRRRSPRCACRRSDAAFARRAARALRRGCRSPARLRRRDAAGRVAADRRAALAPVGAVAARGADLRARDRRRTRALFGRFVPGVASSTSCSRRATARRGWRGVPPGRDRPLLRPARLHDLRRGRLAGARLEVLNRYLEAMSEAVLAHGGTVVSLLGDGVMAVFGSPLERPTTHGPRFGAAASCSARACRASTSGSARAASSRCASASASTPVRSCPAPWARSGGWSTPPWATRPTWPRVCRRYQGAWGPPAALRRHPRASRGRLRRPGARRRGHPARARAPGGAVDAGPLCGARGGLGRSGVAALPAPAPP